MQFMQENGRVAQTIMNYTLLTDFYELTMANGYFENGMKDEIAYFDMFFRKVPDNAGFAIMAGVEQVIDYLKELRFNDDDIQYLKEKGIFSDDFIEYLKNFEFKCDVWAIPEGTPIFPNEPIVTVRGPLIQAQFIETMILLTINHQSLIATKCNRIVRAAEGRPIMEFGSRRAQGPDGAILGARAAYIGGAAGTACTTESSAFRRLVQWRTAGCSRLIRSTRRSARMRWLIQKAAHCLLIRLTC